MSIASSRDMISVALRSSHRSILGAVQIIQVVVLEKSSTLFLSSSLSSSSSSSLQVSRLKSYRLHLHLQQRSRSNKAERLQMKKTELALTTYLVKADVRYVVPYKYEYKTFAKGRWIGRKIFDVLSSEFGGSQQDSSYWKVAIEEGLVKVNGQKVTADYPINHKDYISHCTHRHEPPVSGSIEFVAETADLVAVCKPPSLPIHPCGSYRFNSLEYILAKEDILPTKSELYVIHRLDKVTSGLVVLAKSKDSAIRMQKIMQSKDTKKTYLARVRGRFPDQNILDKIRRVSVSSIIESVLEGDDCDDSEVKSSASAETGGAMDEAGHETSKNNSSSSSCSSSSRNSSKRKGGNNSDGDACKKAKTADASGASGGGSRTSSKTGNQHSSGGDAPKLGALTVEEANEKSDLDTFYQSARVNFAISDSMEASHLSAHIQRMGDETLVANRTIYLQCPLGIMSFKEGTHIWRSDGKNCVSAFKSLGYDEESDTTLVECDLYTGRSHQLRLHLQFLGTPIANDPCYGGEMFYEDSMVNKNRSHSNNSSGGGGSGNSSINRKERARSMLKVVKKLNLETLTRLKHMLKDDDDADGKENGDDFSSSDGSGKGTAVVCELEDEDMKTILNGDLSDQLKKLEDDYVFEQMKTCTDEKQVDSNFTSYKNMNLNKVSTFAADHVELLDSVRKNCKFCMQRDVNIEVERLLHCDGIWLHSYKYRGPHFEFTSPLPAWAACFRSDLNKGDK